MTIRDYVDRIPHRLRAVTPVAPGPEVIERQTQVRSLLDRNLMIRMQVAFTLAEPFPQLGQNLLHWRRPQLEAPEVCHHVRLPSAVHASPLVADEAENA
jgi:hypothetical protein